MARKEGQEREREGSPWKHVMQHVVLAKGSVYASGMRVSK